MTVDEDPDTLARRDSAHMRHRANLESLAESTRRLREHNDEIEARERMRARGSLPSPKGQS